MPLYDVDVEGVTYEVNAPNEQTAWQWANYTHRQKKAAKPAAPKESTIGGEFVRGAKQLISTTRTGLGALLSPEEAARAGVERGQQIAAEAGEGPSFAAVRKAYEERGLLPAAGEAISQIPRALAGQGAQLAAMAGGARLGAMAGAPFGPVGAVVGGVGGAGLSLLPQFFGANIERQAAEQMERGEPLDISRTAAGAAAAGQAGIEAAGTAFVLGKRIVKGVLGIADDAALATAKAQAELAKTAQRSFLASAGRGAVRGTAEIPVEIAQAIIERAQAGLDLTSPEALAEYGENAYLAGLVGPTLGGIAGPLERRGARAQVAQQEQEEAAKAAAAARKAEEEAKKAPEYLQQKYQDYQTLLQQKNALEAQLKRAPKGTKLSQEDADANAVINQELKPLRAQVEEARQEFLAAGGPQAIAKQRLLPRPEDEAFEIAAQREVPQEAQKLPYFQAPQGTLPGIEPTEASAAPVEEEFVDYATQIKNLRAYKNELREKAETTSDLQGKLQIEKEFDRVEDALKQATELAKTQKQPFGKQVDSLRSKMAAAEANGDIKAQAKIARQLMELGVTDMGTTLELDLGKPQPISELRIPTDLADYEAAKKRTEEQKRRQQALAKEAYERTQQTAGMYADVAAAAQRRAADRAATEAEAKTEAERTQREEALAEQLLQATGAVQPQPAPQARIALPTAGTREGLYDQAAELRARLAFAQQTRNKVLENTVRQQLDRLGAPVEETPGSALEAGDIARVAGVEGALTPEAIEQNRLTRLAQRQLLAYDQLVKHVTRAREREQVAVDENTKAQYKYRAEQLKQAAIGFAIQEINGRRQQYGLPVLEQKETMRAVTGLARPLNELIARGAQMFEEPVVVRGQQRGVRLVEGAQEFERPPAGKRTFSEAGFPAAAETLRGQFRETVETIAGRPEERAAARPVGTPIGPRRRVPTDMFLRPSPAEEPVALAPAALFDNAIAKAASAEDAQLLRQAQEIYTQLPADKQSVVREQAERVIAGKDIDAVYELRGLYQMQQREAAVAAGQRELLHPITIVNARRNIERLAQKAAALEKQASEAKAFADKVKAGEKSERERAQAAFDRAREQGKDLIATATELRKEQTKERLDAAGKVTALEEKQRELSKEWDDVVRDQFGYLQTRYQFLREEVAAGRAPKTNLAELAQLDKLLPGAADRVVKISKALDKAAKQVAAAKKEQQAVLERQAADVITSSVLRDAAKAEEKITTAQQRLASARKAEKDAERAHRAVVAEAPREPTLLEQIEALPLGEEGVTRVFRDIDDPGVQAQATQKRSAIAREEGNYAKTEALLKTADAEAKPALQAQLKNIEARLQNLHDELYDIYGNAPLKRVQSKTAAAALTAERLERARHETHDAEIESFNATHDTARLSLPPRKAGPVIKEKGAVKEGGERVVRAEPETPIADILTARQRLAEIAQQLAYIKANKAKSAEGRKKQATVKEKLLKEREKLSVTLREKLKEQTQVVKEEKAVASELKKARRVSRGAIKRAKLQATDEQLFQDLAKADKTKEQAALFERAENVFGEMAATEQAFVRRQANAIIGKRAAEYKPENLADIVAAAESRKEREGEEPTLPARGVEVESPDLTSEQVAALENNDVAQALALLSTDKGADPVHRAVAQRLAQLLDKTNVEVKDTLTDEEGTPVLGQALASGKTIRLSRAGGLTQEILLHEGTHAAAERVLMAPESSLTPTQLAAKRELQALHAAVKRDPSITSTDAKASLSEFVAEVMSNRNLQQQLAKKPWKLSDALKGFKSIVLRLLGIKETQSMLGAAMKSVDAIFMPTSVQTFKAEGVRTQYSQKDIAALHDGSNSMRQFAENFPQYIKQKDRTPADVDRIGLEYLKDMDANPEDYVASVEPDRLDYKSDTIMSDGTVFDPDNPLHLVEATPATFVALKAQEDANLRKEEAAHITKERQKALVNLINGVLSGSGYTRPEQALVAKAASKYGVQSTPEGKLKLVTIDPNNRHPVAVVSEDAARAIIEELRSGKNLKAAFLDGMQRVADNNAERNKSKNGWQKFEIPTGVTLSRLYTEQEVNEAFDQTGYDAGIYQGDALIERLIEDGLLPDRRALIKTAKDVEKIEKAAIELNAGAAGTSWCTGASVYTARSQIEEGDFYIYYKDGRPEVAVRMLGKDKIAEIRGNTPQQWLTPEQQEIATAFLKTQNFEGTKEFLEETDRKALLTRIFTNKEKRGDSFIFVDALDTDQKVFRRYGLDKIFKFRTLDGYASSLRPKPSEKLTASIYNKALDLLVEDASNGYIPFDVTFEADGTGSMAFGGQTVTNIKASEIIEAKSIISPYKSIFDKEPSPPLIFNNLKKVKALYLSGETELRFPKLETAERVVIFNEHAYKLVLADKTVIDLLTTTADGSIIVDGGYFVRVQPVTSYGNKIKSLKATINAPYVSVLPYEKRFSSDPEPSEAPKPEVKTPNKIADVPPIETVGPAAEDRLLFARSNLPTASRVAENLIAEQPGIVQKLKSNLLGLGGRTQFIDKLAPVEEALKRGKVEDLKATQALYYLRMYDQRMHFTSQAITDGVPELVEKTRRDGRTERMIETKPGANIKQVVDILKKKDVVKAAGSADAANKLFTLYLAAIRGERVGYDTLNFGRAWAEGEIKRLESELRSAKLSSEARTNLQKKKASLEQRLTSMPTEADFKAAKAEIDANPVLANEFGKARDIYNQYNRNLIEFAVQAGSLDRALGNKLVASNDYIPYYRMREGVAELMIGKETPIRVGNLKDSPHLQELVGGDEAIFDFLESSVQNTSMLLDMATKNLATKNLMFELRDVGLAKISKATKTAPAGAVTFKKDGEEYFAIVDTDTLGIDSELLVKGLAGIPTMFPTFVRLFGIPARFLRRVVVASPVYMARQIMRESTSAAIASGADIVPVLSSLKQIGKPSSLERRGITGGQVFTGMPEDQTRILKDMQAGKISLLSGLAWLESKSAKVDALTREAQYQSYLKQGLSEMEASLMALESANFSKRGLSPTMHMVSTLIPFLNAQIQGLDVLYKAFTGKMPMNERLAVRQKLWERGMLMFGLSTLYALSMDEEDEYYKNAKPEEKYGNWFVPIPGMKEPLRVPIPFELGYIFKALPEAMVNIVRDDKGAEEAWKAFKHIGMQTVPGLSSYFMPQAIKPALEVLLDRSFYTDRALESAREQMLEPGFRYRDNTTELAKWVGEATGFSPIKMEYLIRGYTGDMGMAALAMLSAPFGRTGPEPATKRVTDLPVIGTLFQPVDASGIIDMAYEKMNKVRQVQDTYKNLLEQGRTADANAYLKENADQMALASVAGSFRQQMGEITQYERAVRVSNLTPDQKREALDRARQAKIRLAETVRAMSDRTARQAAPA